MPDPAERPSLEQENAALREEIRQLRAGRDVARVHQAQSDSDERRHARFQAVFDNSPFGQKIINPDLVIQQANQAVLDLLGCRLEDVVGHRIQEFAHPDHRADWAVLQEQLWHHQRPSFTLETCLVRADGSFFWCQVTSIRFPNEDGELGYTQLENITGRKQMEAVLRASKAQQAYLLALSDALRPLTDSGELQATAVRVLGEHLGVDRAYYVDVDEAANEFVAARDWHRPDAPSHARRYPLGDWPMPWLLDGCTWVCPDVATDPVLPDAQRADYCGNDMRAAVVVPLLKHGRLMATLVVEQNTPREWTPLEVALVEETLARTWAAAAQARAEEALRASEEQRRAQVHEQQQHAWTQGLLDALPNPIWVTDARGHVQFANAAQTALSQQLAPRQAAFARAQGPELRRAAALRQQVLATGREATLDLTFVLNSGQPRDYHVTMCALRQTDGAVHVLTVGTDVTELKQAQRAALAAAQAHEHFLATMSHEIRTPLNGMLGMAGLLAKTSLTAEQRRHLDVVQHSGYHLLALLNDVLDMAKIRSGNLHLEAVPVDVAHTLNEVVQALAWQAQAKGLALDLVGFAAPLPWVRTDPMRLKQVLLNLLGNAVKFTERGGVTLHAAVRTETADHLGVHFHVRDTGPGVALAAQEHIFATFAQAAADTTRRFGGTGLGLAISSQLVAELGGHLVLCSEEGRGSTFAFTIAFAKCAGPPATASPGPGGEPPSLQGWRVLVVDDNAWNQELARAVLEHHGVRVDVTVSAAEALALFAQHRYDVVLMDVHMPGMNGLEATARLRQHPDPDRAATPVLAVTADAFPAQHASYRAAGMSDVLAKPFTEAELLAKLVALVPPHRAETS